MKGSGLNVASALFVAAAVLASAVPASAEPSGRGPMALIALDDAEGTEQAVSRMASLLASTGRRVEFGGQVAETLAARRVPRATPEEMAAFAGTSDVVAEGIKAYFYRSKERALETLSPVVRRGITKTEVLVERPDLVDQIYEAGIVMVRAQLDSDNHEEADELAAALVANFPAKAPNLDTAPPKIIEIFAGHANRMAQENSRIVLTPRVPDGADCVTLLNGTSVSPGSHNVAANRDYYVGLDCGVRRSPTWRATTKPGEVQQIVLIPDDPLSVDLADDSFDNRRRAEDYLAAVAALGGYAEVVGVKRPGAGDGPTLFAHYRDGSFIWTEAGDVSAVVGYAEEAFGVTSTPDVEATDAQGSSVRWVGIGFVTGGALAVTGGAISLAAAGRNHRRLQCYDNSASSGVDCTGVECTSGRPCGGMDPMYCGG